MAVDIFHDGQMGEEIEELEWEYEYDPEQTEDYYVTLDLTSNVGPRRQKPISDPSSTAAINAGDQRPSEPAGESASEQPQRPSTAIVEDDSSSSQQDRMQILELHGSNPIISYQGRLYSCHWASTVGSDILFIEQGPAANAVTEEANMTVRPSRSYDLLSISSTKLLATNAQLEPRRRMTSATNACDERLGAKIPVETHVSDSKKRQARFLERLSAAKISRGEDGRVPVTSFTRRNNGLLQRKASILQAPSREGSGETMEEPSLSVSDTEQAVATPRACGTRGTPRARSRGRRRRASRGFAALFGDRFQNPYPTNVMTSMPTPATWDQLEGPALWQTPQAVATPTLSQNGSTTVSQSNRLEEPDDVNMEDQPHSP